jgi:hypothetical protein
MIEGRLPRDWIGLDVMGQMKAKKGENAINNDMLFRYSGAISRNALA